MRRVPWVAVVAFAVASFAAWSSYTANTRARAVIEDWSRELLQCEADRDACSDGRLAAYQSGLGDGASACGLGVVTLKYDAKAGAMFPAGASPAECRDVAPFQLGPMLVDEDLSAMCWDREAVLAEAMVPLYEAAYQAHVAWRQSLSGRAYEVRP